jgi:hypothetical protein
MTFQEKYSRLLAVIDREDLNDDEIRFIQWICKWSEWEYSNFVSIVNKLKNSSI